MENKQLSKEWFAERVGKITASNVGAILGHSKYRSPDDVMRSMVREHFGDEKEFTGNIATEWGNDHEYTAVKALEVALGEEILESGFIVHPEFDWAGASPDGRLMSGLVEIKCPFSKKLFDISERQEYYDQVQFQMLCAEEHSCVFCVWTPSGMHYETVNRSDQWCLDNWGKLQEFYKEFVAICQDEERHAVYREELVQDMESNNRWNELCLNRANIKAEADKLKAQLDQINDELKQLADGKKSSGSGVLVYPISGRKTVNYKAAIKSTGIDVDLNEFTKVGKDSWGIKDVK